MEQGFDTGTDMRTSVTNTVDVTLVLGALDQFDQVTRDLITLRYIEGWRVKDIAQSLGISQTSASVRLHRAMHILKRQLAV
jgi:RNA polymerase sigma factor (sigma-70 family)